MKSTKFLFLAKKKALAAKLGLFVDRDLVAFEGLKPLVSILESLFYDVTSQASQNAYLFSLETASKHHHKHDRLTTNQVRCVTLYSPYSFLLKHGIER